MQLLASELVANALRHGPGGPVDLDLDAGRDSIRVEVADNGAGFDPLGHLRRHVESEGRHHGLALLNALADRWGFRIGPDGFRMWFELDLVSGRRPWRGREPVAAARRSQRHV